MSQRRPHGPATPRAGRRRPVAGRSPRTLRTALVGVVAGVALVLTAAPAVAVPAPPPNPTDGQLGAARSQQEAAAAEVGRIRALVATAEADLERVGVLAEAAGTAYEAAVEELQLAQEAADRAADELRAADEAVAAAALRIAEFSRDSYMNGGSLTSSAALLDAEGPGELIQRAAMLDYVAANQLDVLGQFEIARVRQANAESSARATRDERAAAEETAEAAKAQADAQLATQQAAYAEIETQKAQYEQQLQAAQIHLLELQGARNAYDQWVAQKAAEEAAAREAAERAAREAEAEAEAARERADAGSGGGGGGGAVSGSGYVKPTSGRVSSCYGWRWGALHGGVDIAAPIGTDVYAVASGVVRRAGTATGFGYAVYIEGDDGAVTVYGHVHRYFVAAGQRVSAGQKIAEVGNRGQSTGPHLHFEVHPSGQMYSGHVDPVPWLNARGVFVGGCGG
ncbi:M23 family metallopeptidase [Blastococcus sp. MG754426]|uniref:M23 family metallopeptidase n=1 Tax=unclassified Blastococcus TaxID=2619396 RepID=UPI001EF07D94|nr:MULTISPECIES: M23 family metallopeptidase [unclassified Blastococcus]MCF6509912.1 M23 family metallopeptidase [Blastococcus sp. MG754426]MCF6514304.1 M23 family metallopeptidase [Blastococcus sp. MG754427]MCF6737487.1 M23 family metallopeptidase [Blastococcus sp. KM273129]